MSRISTDYDAYGACLWHECDAGSVGQPYQYVGQLGYYTCWQEPDFGLLQLGVRFYDPQAGRFTSRDPLQSGPDRYAYAYEKPTGSTDPTGLWPGDWDWVVPNPWEWLFPPYAVYNRARGWYDNTAKCKDFVDHWYEANRDCQRIYESKISANCWDVNGFLDSNPKNPNGLNWVRKCSQRRMRAWFGGQLKEYVEHCGQLVKDIVHTITGGAVGG